MILKQYYLGCLAHASYLIGDRQTGTAVVVDPQRDIDQYLADAQAQDLRIRHVFLTHIHADFVAGHLELRDRVGARIHVGAQVQTEYEATPMADDDQLCFGQVKLVTLQTPGHTPESICILVYDLTQSAETPQAVLTGDTLFIGDVGRPDLGASAGWNSTDLAALLYDSLHSKLLPRLPDETLVYPAHGAGSLCGKSLSEETYSTMGVQRQYNYALQAMDKDTFVNLVTADQPEAPSYFSYDAALNTKERQTLETSLASSLKELPLDQVLALQRSGTQVLDVREGDDFAGAHLQGSVNIDLDGKFASWAGALLAHDRPIVLIAAPGTQEEAAMRLERIGFDEVAGYLQDGMMALAQRPDLVASIERITALTVDELGREGDQLHLTDVRAPGEYADGHIRGAVNIPLQQLPNELAQLPRDQHLVVYCAGGYRSAIAASLLRLHGFAQVSDLVGGFSAWGAAGLPSATDNQTNSQN
ncbi:MAG: MBL fold metallo-hydrolase [Candidatus Latescibacteria bacterium]|nr:MBL fold metallo-hydrolase [Candidatus Latescibacterota bacterium]